MKAKRKKREERKERREKDMLRTNRKGNVKEKMESNERIKDNGY